MAEAIPIVDGCRWSLAVRWYVDGRLSDEMKERVRGHLAGCKACGATFGAELERALLAEAVPWWRSVVRALRRAWNGGGE